MSTKHRILEYLKFKGVRKKEFFQKTGIKRGFLDSNKLEGIVSDVFIAKIIANYKDLNLKWLITGEDEMILDIGKNPEIKKTKEFIPDPLEGKDKMLPLFNLNKTNGLANLCRNLKTLIPSDYLSIPNLPVCDAAIHIQGDNMSPLLNSGDIIIFQKIQNNIENIIYGEMYLISIDLGNSEYVSINWIQKSDKGPDYIKMVSENNQYSYKDILFSKIMVCTIIKSIIRVNSMY